MILRSLFCLTVVALTASQIEWKEPAMNPHKAALIRKQIYAVYQPDFLDPLPGSPASITESLIEMGDHTSDTSQIVYTYQRGLLMKADAQKGQYKVTYYFTYDAHDRIIAIDMRGPAMSYHRDTIVYNKEGAVRTHYFEGKQDQVLTFHFMGNADYYKVEKPFSLDSITIQEDKGLLVVETFSFTGKNKKTPDSQHREVFDKKYNLLAAYSLENGQEVGAVYYTYDKYNNQVSRREQNNGNTSQGSDTTVLEYDNMGNWTRREYKNASGNYTSIMTRKITY